MKVHRIYADGVAINDTSGAMTSNCYLDAVLVHVNTAATTSEYLTVTLDSVAGEAHDVVLYKIDLAAASTTDIVITPSDLGIPLLVGDAINTIWTNTDARRIGITYLLR